MGSRSANRLAKKSKRNFVVTLALVAVLVYSTLNWILPSFITSIGVVKDVIQPSQKTTPLSKNSILAPPVFNIPYEATNSAQIDIRGYGSPDSKVNLFVDDKDIQIVETEKDGSFIFQNVSLSLGTNNIYGKTVDEQGSESLASKNIKIIYDNEKPTLIISDPVDGKTIQGGEKKVKLSGKTDPGVKIYIENSQVIVDKDGNFSTEQPLLDGDNFFDIKAADAAGNTSQEQRRVTYLPPQTQ